MKKVTVLIVLLAVTASVGGSLLLRKSDHLRQRHARYENAIRAYENVSQLFRAGDLSAAESRLAELSSMQEAAAKKDPAWENLRPYLKMEEALVSYGIAELMYLRHAKPGLSASKEPLPDPETVLSYYKRCENALREVAGSKELATPELAWRAENDAATAVVWQMAIRLALENAKFEDVKPLYDTALAGYKKAHKLAEAAGSRAGNEFENPSRITSQNLDFMTRLQLSQEEQQQQQQQQPQQGYGDMMDGSGNQEVPRTLPMPSMNIGRSRLTGGVK